jgi:uncharacterized protein (DUF433 family)
MTVTGHTTMARVADNPRIQGGEPTISETRVPVRSIVVMHQLRNDIERVRRAFPMLDADAIREALAFYERNREEIDAYIRANESDDEG